MTCAAAADAPVVSSLFRLRQSVPEDWPLIRDSWRKSSKDVTLAAMGMSKDAVRNRLRARCPCKGDNAECASCAAVWATRREVKSHIQDEHNRTTERLEKRCSVIVAAADDNPREVFGYVLFEKTDAGPLIHWVYVKHGYRRVGLATQLIAASLGPNGAVGRGRYTVHAPAADRLVEAFGLRFTPSQRTV